MGLLMFKERSPDDKSPFLPNEFHVGRRDSTPPAHQPLRTIEGRIRRGVPAPSSITQERRAAARRRNALLTVEENSSNQFARYRQMMEYLSHRTAEDSTRPTLETPQGEHTEAEIPATSTTDAPPVGGPVLPLAQLDEMADGQSVNGQPVDGQSVTSSQEEDATAEHPSGEVDMLDSDEELTAPPVAAIGHPASNNFAPAHHYYEDLQREPYFEVAPAQGRAQTPNSQTDSPDENNRWRVGSPGTEQAILQEIRNQEDSANRRQIYIDTSTETPSPAPGMAISQVDGLGDRSRSPSRDGTQISDAEENWNELLQTIPRTDANLPNTGSSFASDSASSILSRSRPRSSLTNTTADSGSRDDEDDAEAGQPVDQSASCPEGVDRPGILERLSRRTSSLAPVRYSPATTTDRTHFRSTISSLVPQETLDSSSGIARHGLDGLDNLMDMINSGVDVPAEMWVAVGMTPHLALRGGAGRHPRNERL